MARAAAPAGVMQQRQQHQQHQKPLPACTHPPEQQQHDQHQKQTAATARLPRRVGAASFHDLRAVKRPRPGSLHSSSTTTQPTSTSHRQQQQRFSPLHAPFRTFAAQREAFSFLDAQPCAPILRTFAVETSANGQRVFLVTSAELFWAHYRSLPAGARHHYEIIRAGTPCHLFFDLEFCRASNLGLDGAALVALLLAGVAEQLAALWDLPWHPGWALELDSSTPDKFSRHVIVRLPGLAFADACHAGRMARRVLLCLLARGAHSSRPASLLVAAKGAAGTSSGGGSSSQLSCFVDMGVYTRNRAFRLLLSSKFGKTAQLRLTHRWGGRSRCPRTGFHDSLVSVLPCSQHSSSSSSSSRSSMGGGRPLSLLRVPDDGGELLQRLPAAWQQVAMLQLRPLEHVAQAAALAGGSNGGSAWQQQQQYGVPGNVPSAQPCFGPSPLPQLDAFIASICSTGGVRGEVRSHVLHCPAAAGSAAAAAAGGPAAAGAATTVTMQYAIRGNRWCGNVGRQHKSNGIYFSVDLARGVYCQRCWDPECRHYRSPHMPLPADVWQACRRFLEQSVVSAPAAAAGPSDASAGAAEDDSYLQLLADFEAAHAAAGAAQQQQQDGAQLLQQHVACNTALAGADASDDDDDEACLQLLMQVEQQQAARQRGRGLTAA